MTRSLSTSRLHLRPMSRQDFDVFVDTMLTDKAVVEFYNFYRDESDLSAIRRQAKVDFWEHFEESRTATGLEIWSIFEKELSAASEEMIGWAGVLHTELSEEHGGPELQYMIASRAFGKGYATEAAVAVVDDVFAESQIPLIIATVDIPNLGSIRVLEKLGFERRGQIRAYDSDDMFLYTRRPN